MRIGDIIDHIDLISVHDLKKDAVINHVSFDSRDVKEGDLFVAITGNIQDGAIFIQDAISKGASIIVTEKDIPLLGVTVLVVANARKALAVISDIFFNSPSKKLKVIGITGTNGKTTTAYITKNLLINAGMKVGLISTVEYVFGDYREPAMRTTPDVWKVNALLASMVEKKCDCVVMEVSSHALEQGRVYGIEFDVVAFTNLTPEHLDYHHTMDAYLQAKLKLFKQFRESNNKIHVSVINADDDYAAHFLSVCGNSLLYSLDHDADISFEKADLFSRRSQRIVVNTIKGKLQLQTSLFGRHNLSNILCAVAIALGMGVSLREIGSGMMMFAGIAGRCEFVEEGQCFDVVIDYAHTDDALRKILEALRELAYKRIILVFGCGGDRDSGKRPLMGKVATALADYTILTSDNPRSEEPNMIIEDIKRGIRDKSNFEIQEDRFVAIEKAIQLANTGDCVLIAGKGHEKGQEVKGEIIPFDDKQVAIEMIKKKEYTLTNQYYLAGVA